MFPVYKKVKNVTWKKNEDNTICLHLENTRQIVELNRSASLIWEWIDGKNNAGQIAKKLSEYYKIPMDQSMNDVLELIEMWIDDDLIRTDLDLTATLLN